MGHRYFRKYLYNLNRVQTPFCKSCGHDEETAEHICFGCPRWNDYRKQTEETIRTLTPENFVGKMLRNEAGWGAVATFIERVQYLKRKEGHLDD